jgi:hypothetical protein
LDEGWFPVIVQREKSTSEGWGIPIR